MYSSGGCIASPGSCNNGFRSRPSSGIGYKRSKGFDVNNIKERNPALIIPMTAITCAWICLGILPPSKATARVQLASMNAQSSKEPS